MKRLKHSVLNQKPNLIPCLLVLISFLLIPSVLAADFDSGLLAYKEGDYATALKECRPLAEQGDARAQFLLGKMYANGLGVPQDDKEAVIWGILAAEKGHSGAQAFLGAMYANGRGVTQDDKEAAKWYRMAAEQGLDDAQYLLGAMYEEGGGVPQDDREAVKWFRLAAEQGHNSAQVSLGAMYANGRGVPQDDREAVKWYRVAAEQGDASAQFKLSAMYLLGRGVPQDYVQAHMWLNLAGANGKGEAAKLRDELAEKMTPQQLAEAQRLAGQWKKKSAPTPSPPGLPDNEPETSPRISSSGTGFVCGTDLIATNYHAIQNGSKWEITFPTSGRTYPLQLVTADKTNDLAVLRIILRRSGETGKPKPLIISAFSPARIGKELYTIGFPLGDLLGSSQKVATGVLSSSVGIDDDPRMFQITVPVQPGNSGGPIFNSKGQVIGILVSILSSEFLFKAQGNIPKNVNFAIKSDYLLALIGQSSLARKDQAGNHSNLSRADQVEVLRDSIGQVKTVSGSVK